MDTTIVKNAVALLAECSAKMWRNQEKVSGPQLDLMLAIMGYTRNPNKDTLYTLKEFGLLVSDGLSGWWKNNSSPSSTIEDFKFKESSWVCTADPEKYAMAR